MSFDLAAIREEMAARAGGAWEIYAKQARSRETRVTVDRREESERREEGYAARWMERGASLFAAASSPEQLLQAVRNSSRIPRAPGPALPPLPSGRYPEVLESELPPQGELFEALSNLLASESKGQARLTAVSAADGVIVDRLENGAGFSGGRFRKFAYGNAQAVGVAGDRRVGADIVFLREPAQDEELARIARSLADRALLPLKGRPLPFPRGSLLLDPAVGAALLAETLPLFCGDALKKTLSSRYLDREGRFTAEGVNLVDDGTLDGPFDGEGTPVRRNIVVADGVFRRSLHDLGSAHRAREQPTGNALRDSFRHPPRPGTSCFFLESDRPAPPAQMLEHVARGLYASAVTSPPLVDLENDRLQLEVEGWAIQAGRARSPVARASVSARLSDVWRRLSAAGSDRRWFFHRFRVGVPTLLVERVSFS